MKVFIKFTLIAAFTISTAAFTYAQDPKPTESPAPQKETKPSTDVKAGDSQQSKADSQKATIYFYRIKQFAGSGLEPSVYCDDKELARMDNGRYFGVTLEPSAPTGPSHSSPLMHGLLAGNMRAVGSPGGSVACSRELLRSSAPVRSPG